jgi:hypothetical protein
MAGTGSYLARLETERVVTNTDDPPQRRKDMIMIGVNRRGEEK